MRCDATKIRSTQRARRWGVVLVGLALAAGAASGAEFQKARVTRVTLEEAAARLGFRPRLPRWLPQGMSRESIAVLSPWIPVFSDRPPETVDELYNRHARRGARYGFVAHPAGGGGWFTVIHVAPNSPAGKAGLRQGDVMVRTRGLNLRRTPIPGGPLGATASLWYFCGPFERRVLRKADLRLFAWNARRERPRLRAAAPMLEVCFAGGRGALPFLHLLQWRTTDGFFSFPPAKSRFVRVGAKRCFSWSEELSDCFFRTSGSLAFQSTALDPSNDPSREAVLRRIVRSVPD